MAIESKQSINTVIAWKKSSQANYRRPLLALLFAALSLLSLSSITVQAAQAASAGSSADAGANSGQAATDNWVYTVRPNDDLWSIAKRYCGSIRRADDIARFNQLANPTALRAGTRISIPTRWLAFAPSRAQITMLAGEVSIRRAQQNQLADALLNDFLDMGDRLITREGSVQVTFADASTVSISPFSEVLFNKLTAFGPAGMVDTHLRFAYGEGHASVREQNLGDRFRIQTPEGIAAVRGTEFRVGHSAPETADASSRTETLEGEVAFFDRSQATTDLPAGFGVVASITGVTKEALLPPPDWQAPASNRLALEDNIAWQASPGAGAYIITWYHSATPGIIAKQNRIEAPSTTAPVDVEPGNYALTLRAVSKNGIHGLEARKEVAILEPAPLTGNLLGADVDAEQRNIQLRWEYGQPNSGQDTEFEVFVRAEHWDSEQSYKTRDNHLFVDLLPGQYTWQVKAQESSRTEPSKFELRPPAPTQLTAEGSKTALNFSWAPNITNNVETSEYLVQLVAASGKVIDQQTLSQPSYSVTVPNWQTYTLSVRTRQNGVVSEAATLSATPERSHWWLLLLALPVLLI